MGLTNNLNNRVPADCQSHSVIDAVIVNCVRYKLTETLRFTLVCIVYFLIKLKQAITV